jgi:hypothetical protein
MSKIKNIKDKVVTHVGGHKSEYITGAVCLMVGAAGSAVVLTNGSDTQIVQRMSALLNWKPTQIVNNQSIKALGHPGFRIRDNETGIEYPSIHNTAKELGISKTDLQNHLHGRRQDAGGRTFTILGLMMTPQPTSAMTW